MKTKRTKHTPTKHLLDLSPGNVHAPSADASVDDRAHTERASRGPEHGTPPVPDGSEVHPTAATLDGQIAAMPQQAAGIDAENVATAERAARELVTSTVSETHGGFGIGATRVRRPDNFQAGLVGAVRDVAASPGASPNGFTHRRDARIQATHTATIGAAIAAQVARTFTRRS